MYTVFQIKFFSRQNTDYENSKMVRQTSVMVQLLVKWSMFFKWRKFFCNFLPTITIWAALITLVWFFFVKMKTRVIRAGPKNFDPNLLIALVLWKFFIGSAHVTYTNVQYGVYLLLFLCHALFPFFHFFGTQK